MTCLLLLTQIPEAYSYFQKQTAGFFLPLSMLGPWIIFYLMEKLINTVPSHCSKLHSPVFLPMLHFKIKIEIQMCFLIARERSNFESVKTLEIKIIIKVLKPQLTFLPLQFFKLHLLGNLGTAFKMKMMILQVFAILTQLYSKSCRSEQFNLNCPSAQLSRGWFKILPLKSLIQWLLGEILQYNLKKLICFLMWRLLCIQERPTCFCSMNPHFTSWISSSNVSKQGCNPCVLPLSLQKWAKTFLKGLSGHQIRSIYMFLLLTVSCLLMNSR